MTSVFFCIFLRCWIAVSLGVWGVKLLYCYNNNNQETKHLQHPSLVLILLLTSLGKSILFWFSHSEVPSLICVAVFLKFCCCNCLWLGSSFGGFNTTFSDLCFEIIKVSVCLVTFLGFVMSHAQKFWNVFFLNLFTRAWTGKNGRFWKDRLYTKSMIIVWTKVNLTRPLVVVWSLYFEQLNKVCWEPHKPCFPRSSIF